MQSELNIARKPLEGRCKLTRLRSGGFRRAQRSRRTSADTLSRMKTILFGILLMPCIGHGDILFSGDTLYAEFTTMEIGTIGGAGLSISFGQDSLTTGEVLKLEIFEDSMEEDPVYARNFFGVEGRYSGFSHIGEIGDELFSDFQGIVVFSMESGSVEIEDFWLGTWINEVGYRRRITNFTSIPERSEIGIVLSLMCFATIVVKRRWCRS